MPPTIAVVIATRDRPSLLHDALAALSASTTAPDRVVVVDSASSDPAVGQVALASGAQLVRCQEPGLGRARNAGIGACREDVVAFTDDDCLPAPDWVGDLVKEFDSGPENAFLTGPVRSDRPPARRAALTVALTGDEDRRTLAGTDDPRTFGHGANMAWRLDALRRIGGFDEAMGVGSLLRAGEDTDAFWRCVSSGGQGMFSPRPTIVHRLWRSRRGMLKSYYGYGVGAGALAVKRARMSAERRSAANRALARRLVVDEGLAPVWRSTRRGYQMAAVADTLMFLGGLRGAALAWRLPVVDGHFRDRDVSPP